VKAPPRASMSNFIRQSRAIGWAAVEALFLLVVLCLLLNMLVGSHADSFISAVAANATAFLQALPPGVFLGLVLIAVIWGFLKSRLLPPR